MKADVVVVGAGLAGLSAARDLMKAGTDVPSFPQLPGEDTWVLADGHCVGDDFPWIDDADRASFAALSDEFGMLARSVDPDDPWSHPEGTYVR